MSASPVKVLFFVRCKKVKENLGNECADIDQNLQEKDFLSTLIPQLLIKSDLKEITTDNVSTQEFIKQQEKKYVPGTNLIIEHFMILTP